MKKLFLVRVLPLIFVVVGAAIAFFGIRDVARAKVSANWPAAHGKVVSSSVKRHYSTTGGRTVISYAAIILYRFSVDGRSFTGKRVSYEDYSSDSSSHAYDVANRYPEGEDVSVYYKPDNPELCLLEPGIKTGAYITPGIGLFFFVLGSLMVIYTRKIM